MDSDTSFAVVPYLLLPLMLWVFFALLVKRFQVHLRPGRT
jgi:hypothetical protein